MGGTSTYGIQQEDGSVIYNIYGDTVFKATIITAITQGATVEIRNDGIQHATSIEDYFSEEHYEEEDSVIRGVMRLDGVLEYRYWGVKGFFTYSQ